MTFLRATYLFAAFLMTSAGAVGQTENPGLAASGQGFEISKGDLQDAAENKLENLELEKQRFQADMARKRHQALEETLEDMVREQILSAEAKSRELTIEELVQQVTASVEGPTPEEVEEFWQSNQSRLKGTREELTPQIHSYLERQKKQGALDEFIDSLKKEYGVSYHLAPLRFDVDSKGRPTTGPENAPVTIVEFSDFQCPYCSRMGPALERIKEEYGDQVQIVFRHFPLTNIHGEAQKAAEASMCAADQGKFWEMHDQMFSDQSKLSADSLKEAASTLGLDVESFGQCLDSGKYREVVQQDAREAMKVGVSGTPAFFVNGRPLSGAVPFETLSEMVEEELERLQK